MAEFVGLCSVYATGPCNDPNLTAIQLGEAENNAFECFWFTAPPGKEREFLATALAAIANKTKVIAGIKDGEVKNWGQVNALYLTCQST